MYILKNALKSITRSKGRNILIGIIVVVISVSACVALSIKEAANKAEDNAVASLEIKAEITIDRQALMKKATTSGVDMRQVLQGTGSLSLDEMEVYSKSSYIKDFYYTLTASLNAVNDGLKPIDTSSSDNSSSNSTEDQKGSLTGGQGMPDRFRGMGVQGDFTVVGNSSKKAMTSFSDGTSTIIDGMIFSEDTSDMVCIISDELATYNSLKVNDTISLVNPNNKDEISQFTILGIYKNSEATTQNNNTMRGFSAASDPANKIYTSYNTLKNITSISSENATEETDSTTGIKASTAIREQIAGTYVFSDVKSYESFNDDVKTMGLDDNYTVSSSDVTNYEKSLVPLNNLSKFATYFLIVVLLIGGIILIVLNIFNIRERKYEIGVLTAIGMKKKKVALQFITEIFIVTFMAISIGTVIGSAISVPTSNALLESQITSQQQESTQVQQNFGMQSSQMQENFRMQSMNGNSNTNETSYITDISASTDLNVVLQLMGIGILLTLISGCVAVFFVSRYEPLKILANRD